MGWLSSCVYVVCVIHTQCNGWIMGGAGAGLSTNRCEIANNSDKAFFYYLFWHKDLPTITPDAGRRAPTIWWNANLTFSSYKCTDENSLPTFEFTPTWTPPHTLTEDSNTEFTHNNIEKLVSSIRYGMSNWICIIYYPMLLFFNFWKEKTLKNRSTRCDEHERARMCHTCVRKLQCSQ